MNTSEIDNKMLKYTRILDKRLTELNQKYPNFNKDDFEKIFNILFNTDKEDKYKTILLNEK